MGILSEFGAHSDRIWAFPRLPVRIQLSFGLDMNFYSASCPNPALFRTGYGLFLGFLSESGSLSDRLWAFPRLPVRILHSFGQDMDFSSASCPNPALIRTGEGLFFDFLSESSSHSDRTWTFPRLSVRTWHPTELLEKPAKKRLNE